MPERDEIAELLELLDHPVPDVRVEDVIARARTRPRWRAGSLVAAGIVFAAGVAAAVPSTAVHRALLRAVAAVSASGSHMPRAAPPPEQRPVRGTGVALVPRARVTVRFIRPPSGIRLRVVFAATAQLSLVPEGGDAAFAVGSDAIVVTQPTARSFVLNVPLSLEELRVERDGNTVLEKRGGTVNTRAPRDTTGQYLLELDVHTP